VNCEGCYSEEDTLLSYIKQPGLFVLNTDTDGLFLLAGFEGLGALLTKNDDIATRHVAQMLNRSNTTAGFGKAILEHCCTKAESCNAKAVLQDAGSMCAGIGLAYWMLFVTGKCCFPQTNRHAAVGPEA
jgi:hypothetical protein